MVKQLCDLWFGYYKLFVSISRFSKKDSPFSHYHAIPFKIEKRGDLVSSYVTIVKGTSKESHGKELVEETIVLPFEDFIMEKRNMHV